MSRFSILVFFLAFLILNPPIAAPAEREFSLQWERFGSERFPDLVGLITVQRGTLEVTDLKPSEFRLYEDGMEQGSLSVTAETEGVDVVLVVDSSGSMREALPKSLQAVRMFIGNLKPADRAALVDFDDRPRVLQTLTSDFSLLLRALNKPGADGGTALYDTLGTAAGLFPREIRRRVVVLLTDGNDQDAMGTGPGSRSSLESALALCRESNLSLFAVGLGFKVDRKVLQIMTDRTGGRAYWAADAGELQDLYLRIGLDIQRRYRIAYRTTNQFRDGSLRRVRIQIQHAGWFGEGSTTYSVAGDGKLEGTIRKPSAPKVSAVLPTAVPAPTVPPTPVPPFVQPTPAPVEGRLEARWDGRALGQADLGMVVVSLQGKILDARDCPVETWPDRKPPEASFYADRRVLLKPGKYRFRHKAGDVWTAAVLTVEAGYQKEAVLR